MEQAEADLARYAERFKEAKDGVVVRSVGRTRAVLHGGNQFCTGDGAESKRTGAEHVSCCWRVLGTETGMLKFDEFCKVPDFQTKIKTPVSGPCSKDQFDNPSCLPHPHVFFGYDDRYPETFEAIHRFCPFAAH